MLRSRLTPAASAPAPSPALPPLRACSRPAAVQRLAAVALLAALALVASAALPAEAEAHAPACPTGQRKYSPWNPQRVYAIPHGCAWLVGPRRTVSGVGPTVAFRIHRTTRRSVLGDAPVGDAFGFCGVDGFLVSWPHFVVTSRRVWLGQGAGCLQLRRRGIASESLLWAGHFRLTRGGWDLAVDFMSPPYRR